MAQNIDARFQQSRKALLNAARELVAEHPVSELSITEVAAAAGISRPTFYQHFADVSALVAAACNEQMQEIFEGIDRDLQGTDLEYLRKLMHMFVQKLYENRTFSRNAVNGPSSMTIAVDTMHFLDAKMRDHVTGNLMGPNSQQVRDRRGAIVAGLVFMVFDWLNSDYEGINEPDAMAERLTDTLVSLAGIEER